jgi:hypothetical protein
MFIHLAVIKQNVCPADQANLHISLRLQQGCSRVHSWVPRCSEITFGVVEWSIALRGMITFRKWVNTKRKIGQCPSPASVACAMFQILRCSHSSYARTCTSSSSNGASGSFLARSAREIRFMIAHSELGHQFQF